MRELRCLWMIPLILTAAAAAADVEPAATRIVIDGKSRIYRTYGWAVDPELWAPLTRELQPLGLVSEWQPGQDHVTLGWNGTVYRWRVVRDLSELRGERPRSGDDARVRALEMEQQLFLPVRTVMALMGGSAVWDGNRRCLYLQFGVTVGRPGAEPGAVGAPGGAALPAGALASITRLHWREREGGLVLEVEATGPIRTQTFRLENPARLVFDFSPATFALEAPLPPRGAVIGARTGQFQASVARLVLDLNGGALTASGIPTTPQKEFTLRLAQGAGARKPIAVVPRSQSARGAAARRPGRLASRGLPYGRDIERIKEAILRGEAVLEGRVICIDAGHGGHDQGAAGITAGILEKDLCLRMALEAAQVLREAGATVVLTRSDDTYLSLDERIQIANDRGVDLFISIHCNAMPRRNSMSGTETYYCTPQSLEFARAIHPYMVGAMGGRDGGIRLRRFAVIRRTQMPSVLLEVGYINHAGDEQKLTDESYQRAIAEAIRDGVIRYFAG